VAKVYPEYQRRLLAANAVDFDDLLLHVATLLADNPELRTELDDRYRYILVDEYQDTNQAQYQIVAGLSQDHPNLCVTGDPDQSIYGWRGARIENILRFERDYPHARIVRLEENFRSTKAILRSADRLIAHNRQRKAKSLITDNDEGTPVELLCYANESAEAEGIAARIEQLVKAGERTCRDFAVFFRVNALSRHLELSLLRRGIPYQVAAGVAFYERAEIKDVLAYLRLVYNPADRAAFLRVVNSPLRGLGETSQRRLAKWADEHRLTLTEAARRAKDVPGLPKRAVQGFRAFAELIDGFSLADSGSVSALLTRILDKTGYTRPWEGSPSEQDQQRLANVQELVTAANQFDEFHGAETSLEAFLEQTALVNETDSLDASQGKVTLMTLHAAKGLEFPVVFILGVEQGLIPHERATRDADPREFEEERRLLFVGMTRARERLYLTQTTQRNFRGRSLHTIPSDFLSELECTLVAGDDGHSIAPAWSTVHEPRGAGERRRPLEFDGRLKLTTAADLLNGSRTSVDLPQGFALGMQVRHPRYGLGTVVDVGGFGQRRTVTVTFADGDRKETFVASKSPLQPAGAT
jgi:DNA helicase-2/ATP-dependent DNA helicase PcrA